MVRRVFGCRGYDGKKRVCSYCIINCYSRNKILIFQDEIERDSSPYEEEALKIAKLVEKKQIQYGDSFGNAHKLLEVLYPKGIPIEKYKDALTVIRIIDKLFRVACGDQGDESAWKDINGYSLLAVVREMREDCYES